MTSAPEEIRRFVDVLGKVPADIRRELRPALRRVAEPVLVEAKSNASWSSRIPGAMRISASFSQKRPGISIIVSKAKAPHARPFEHLGVPGTFRHRVFGHRDRWVEQAARPSLFPAVASADQAITDEAGSVVEQVFRKHGFR